MGDSEVAGVAQWQSNGFVNRSHFELTGKQHGATKRAPFIDGDDCFIPLTRGLVAVVSLADADLGRHAWHAWRSSTWYARHSASNSTDRTVVLHRVIAERMGLGIDGLKVDHRDGNGLNCRRANLRAATAAENSRNRRARDGQYKGVHWHGRDRSWRAQITVNHRTVWLGHFESPIDAARAYDDAAREFHGEFARLNFPDAPDDLALAVARSIGRGLP